MFLPQSRKACRPPQPHPACRAGGLPNGILLRLGVTEGIPLAAAAKRRSYDIAFFPEEGMSGGQSMFRFRGFDFKLYKLY